MILSPYNPLNFGSNFQDNASLEGRHIQTWKASDTCYIEIIHDYPITLSGVTQETIVVMIDETTVNPMKADIAIYNGKYCSVYSIGMGTRDTTALHQVTITETLPGGTTNTAASNQFRVLGDEDKELANTLLISYTHKNNRMTDKHVWVNPYTDPVTQYTFNWRVEGGFKDSGTQFVVDSEQFTTEKRNTLDIYSFDYVIKQLTLGLGEGVPVWYATLLNRILSLSNVTIDGTRVVRNESEAPEIQAVMEGTKSFHVTQNVREVL